MIKRVSVLVILVVLVIAYIHYFSQFIDMVVKCVFVGDHIMLSRYIATHFNKWLTPFGMLFAYITGAILPTFNKAILYKNCLDLYGEVGGVIAAFIYEIIVSSIYFGIFSLYFARPITKLMSRSNVLSGIQIALRKHGFATTLYMRLQAWFPSEWATFIAASIRVRYMDFIKATMWGKAALILSKAMLDNYRLFFIGTPRTIFRMITISLVITVVFIYKYHKKYRKDITDERV